ncbi:hypothetical protein [Photobacterium angustum]|uniref:hypothetical protein n=1 Tax=Photobacterium angustum TaxID=661 RepID=UPI000699699F|nr:hypothetical protein [Photobacterium angustum]
MNMKISNNQNLVFFLVSGMGYPSILNQINNSIQDILDIGDVDYFYIILDCDEDDVESRKDLVHEALSKFTIPSRLNVEIVVQKRCFETILLANSVAMPRNPTTSPLIDYYRYYDVIANDPEDMGCYNSDYTHSQFHTAYAIQALREKRIRYTKSNCSSVTGVDYISRIEERVYNTPHLKSFRKLLESLKGVNEKLVS